jgi:glycosyltransferase involved in cell wall biosynthesis
VATVFQWAQEHGEVGGVLTSQSQLTSALRIQGHEVCYVDTGSAVRAIRVLPALVKRRGLHLFHITRLWRAVVMAPAFALLRGRTVLVLHSGSTLRQVESMRPAVRSVLQQALQAYDEIWAVNDEIRGVLPERLQDRVTVVTPFDPTAALTEGAVDRDRHAMALATNAGLEHYNAELGIEVGRLVRAEWPDATLTVLAYGNDGPKLARLRAHVAAEPWVTLTFDLPPSEVTAMLHRVGTFLRPTSWDGDSVIVREAISSGARVVASDVAPRPRGVEVASLKVAALADAVLQGGTPSDGAGLAETTLSEAAEAALARLFEEVHSGGNLDESAGGDRGPASL